jgi:hypothetical protein
MLQWTANWRVMQPGSLPSSSQVTILMAAQTRLVTAQTRLVMGNGWLRDEAAGDEVTGSSAGAEDGDDSGAWLAGAHLGSGYRSKCQVSCSTRVTSQ